MSDYLRARSPEQKAERMNAIMNAAENLFRDLPYHEINMGLIAKELGWSRSNLYKYAATQEEVFLALHTRANKAFIDDVLTSLEAQATQKDDDGYFTNEKFARVWADAAGKHPEFLRYQDILIAIIESNASVERLVEFKRSYVEIAAPVQKWIERQVGCDVEAAHNLYLQLIYQAPGLYNHFHCAEKTAEAMRRAGIPLAKGTFEEAYASFVTMCLDHASHCTIKRNNSYTAFNSDSQL